MKKHKPMLLEPYIKKFYNNVKGDFAESEGVQPAQVTQWIKKGFMVVNHELMSHRRYLALHPKSKK